MAVMPPELRETNRSRGRQPRGRRHEGSPHAEGPGSGVASSHPTHGSVSFGSMTPPWDGRAKDLAVIVPSRPGCAPAPQPVKRRAAAQANSSAPLYSAHIAAELIKAGAGNVMGGLRHPGEHPPPGALTRHHTAASARA